jgi:hypothetical protein
MPEYILQFGPFDGSATTEDLVILEAASLDDAKLEAAMLYAGASFKATPPNTFRILKKGQTEVYRFPEA